MSSAVILIIDIVLFVVTLTVILLYRQIDKKDRQIHLVKTMMENMKDELEGKFRSMRSSVEVMEDSVQKHEIKVDSLLKQIDSSLTDLDSHAEDLQKLQSYIAHYHRVLKELESLTVKTEKRMQQIKSDLEKMGGVQERIDEFNGQLSEVEDRLSLQTGKFVEEAARIRENFSLRVEQELEEKLALRSNRSAESAPLPEEPENRDAAAGKETAGIELAEDAENRKGLEVSGEAEETRELEAELLFEEEIDLVDDEDMIDYEELSDDIAEIEDKLSKREQVKRFARDGDSASVIAEKTGIPRGEIDLILELIDYSRIEGDDD